MGRQLNFYMSKKMRQEFEDYLDSEGFVYVKNGANEQVTFLTRSAIEKEVIVYLYKNEYGNIHLTDTGIIKYIDGSYNPVIQYHVCRVNHDEKRLTSGRVWITSDDLYDDNADRKLITKEYNRIIRWLKKHLLYAHIEVEKHTYCKRGGYIVKDYIDEEALRMVNEEGYTLG